MKKLEKLSRSIIVTMAICVCSCLGPLFSEVECLYKIEHNNSVIVVQRVLTNATSDNYIQVLLNGEKKYNERENGIRISHVECNDSTVIVYKYPKNENPHEKDTLFVVIW